MRAIVITRPGGPDVLEERDVAEPVPGSGEIRVRVAATALNRADLLQRRGGYPPPPGYPAEIPGLDYAGTVEATGANVQRWKEGDRVMGIAGGGTYAQAVVVHEREAVAVPDGMPLEEAAAVPEVFITAHDALITRLGLASGERLLIHAVGSGVGTAAIQLARATGATPYGTARSGWKLERAAELGLERGVDVAREDFVDVIAELTQGEGVHAVLDLVGAAYFGASLRALATLGRMVVVGTVSGTTAEIDLSKLMRKRLTLVGTVMRARPLEEKIAAARLFERQVVPLLADGRVRPVIDRVVSFSEIRDAHAAMEANQNFGKIVVQW